jgi:hypothetical protein
MAIDTQVLFRLRTGSAGSATASREEAAGRVTEDDFRVPSAETKFVGTMDQEEFVLSWLRHACLPDPAHPEAVVSTLYYDTPALESYQEKVGGDFIKTKCRLRWYDPELSADPALRTAYLEIKHKIGQGRRKSRVGLVVDRRWLDGAALDHPGFAELLARHVGALGERLPPGLAPAAVVEYRRRRFICPATLSRVCLDTEIGLGRVNERRLPRLGPARLGTIVLEIKDAGRVARIPWLAQLHAAGIRQRSFSKYGACIASLLKEA